MGINDCDIITSTKVTAMVSDPILVGPSKVLESSNGTYVSIALMYAASSVAWLLLIERWFERRSFCCVTWQSATRIRSLSTSIKFCWNVDIRWDFLLLPSHNDHGMDCNNCVAHCIADVRWPPSCNRDRKLDCVGEGCHPQCVQSITVGGCATGLMI